MKPDPQPCFQSDKALEEAARRAAERKSEAIERLQRRLNTPRDSAKEEA